MTIPVLIVADSPVMRMGLEAMVTAAGLTVIHTADQLTELPIGTIESLTEVVLLAIDLSEESLATVADWLDAAPQTPLIWLVDLLSDAWITEALRSGVSGILANDATASEIIAAIEAAAAGLVILQPEVANLLVNPNQRSLLSSDQPLTQREIEILRMLAEGMANKTIARLLHISEHTVKFHLSSIFAKLGVSSRTEAVTIGLRRGLILL
jgi:DNA-binding NarL/FixJ family response regulator